MLLLLASAHCALRITGFNQNKRRCQCHVGDAEPEGILIAVAVLDIFTAALPVELESEIQVQHQSIKEFCAQLLRENAP